MAWRPYAGRLEGGPMSLLGRIVLLISFLGCPRQLSRFSVWNREPTAPCGGRALFERVCMSCCSPCCDQVHDLKQEGFIWVSVWGGIVHYGKEDTVVDDPVAWGVCAPDSPTPHTGEQEAEVTYSTVTHFLHFSPHILTTDNLPKQCHQLEAKCGSVAHTLPFHGGVGVCRVFHLAWAHSLSPRGDLHSLQGAVPADSLVS